MTPDAIIALRRRLGWDMRRCAAYLGVDRATWRQWEAGARTPSKANAAALSRWMRQTETAQGCAELNAWAQYADARRALRNEKRAKQSAQ